MADHTNITPTVNAGNLGGSFIYISSGINAQGNHYCSRLYENGSSGYHYSNTDGSYYYRNPDGSTYYNNGHGYSRYISPEGEITETGNQ